MNVWKEFEDKINWDFRIGDEFKNNLEGYAFIVDVFEGVPRLALYKIKKYSCESSPTKVQPPREMLAAALARQGGDLKKGGLFQIDGEIKDWIRENLFKGNHDS